MTLNIDRHNALQLLSDSHRLGATKLKDALLKYIADHFSQMFGNAETELDSLDKELLVDIIKAKASRDS